MVDDLDDAVDAGHVWRSLDAVFRRGGADMDRLALGSLPSMRGSIAKLLELIPSGGCRQSELAQIAGITKQAIGQRLADMTALSYITISADPADGRAQVVQLTRLGREVRQSVRLIISAMEAEWSAEVGAADYAVFRSVLDRLGTPARELNLEQT